MSKLVILVAMMHPDAKIWGFDLRDDQKQWNPSESERTVYLKVDIESDARFDDLGANVGDPYYIHARDIMLAVFDWPRFVQRLFK